MTQKREIRAKDFIGDIRAGMADSALMNKYKLTPRGLQSVFRKLVRLKAIKSEEVYSRPQLQQDSLVVMPARQLERYYLDFDLPIFETKNPANSGFVCDVHEKGVGVRGLDAEVGYTGLFAIQLDPLMSGEPLVLELTCRWARLLNNEDTKRSGFEITKISHFDSKRLNELIQLVTFGD